MAESDQLVEALKEIRDELRALRTELVTRGGRRARSGVRTERVARRAPAERDAGGRRAGRSGNRARSGGARPVGSRDRDSARRGGFPSSGDARGESSDVAVDAGTVTMIPAPAPVVQATQAVAHAVPVAKPLAVAPTPATRQAPRLPPGLPAAAPTTTLASVPAAAKKRVKPDVAARVPAEVASDEDEPLAFPPPPRRVRAHRLSYGPVESEPAKL